MEKRQTFDFQVGDIVRHARYSYRGVIIATDPVCRAESKWYDGGSNAPDRDQPWYLILANDGTERYVAQELLEEDHSGARVDHPLVSALFPTFVDGHYFRQSLN